MNIPFHEHATIYAVLIAGALTGTAAAVSAAPQDSVTSRSGSTIAIATSHAAPAQQSGAIGVMTGAPVKATEQPGMPGTGANPGDNSRAQLQARPQPLTGLTEWMHSITKRLHTGEPTATAQSETDQMYGREGWDPALAHLQETPRSFPWAG
jgi:hypothetical protein